MAELAPGERRLCRLDDIPDGQARGFAFGGRSEDSVFAVRRGETVYVYENICPHIGSPLAWVKDGYLSGDRERIICYLHGARFKIEDGECTVGPCVGEHLTAVTTRIDDGSVVIAMKKKA